MISKPIEEIYDERIATIRDLLVDNGFAVGLSGIKQFYHATRGTPTDPGRYRDIWFSIRCKTEASYRRETSKFEFGIDVPDLDELEKYVKNAGIEVYIFIVVANEEDGIYVTTNKMIHRLGRRWRDDKNFPEGIYFIERGRCQTFDEYKRWFIDYLSNTLRDIHCDTCPESHEPQVGLRFFNYPSELSVMVEFLNDPKYTVTSKHVVNNPPKGDGIFLFYELRERIAEEQKTELNRAVAKARLIRDSELFPAYKELKNATAREIFLLHHFDVGSKDAVKVMELLKDEMSTILDSPSEKK